MIALLAPVLLTACGESYTSVTAASHHCAREANVSIKASGGTFTLTGKCGKVLVDGGNNTLTVEATRTFEIDGENNVVAIGAADSIGVRGARNTVNYKKGLSGKAPNVGVVRGDNNTIMPAN